MIPPRPSAKRAGLPASCNMDRPHGGGIMKSGWTLVMLAVFSFASAASGAEPQDLAQAKRVFNEYVSREQAFDPAVADLYADEALIQNRRSYPHGQVKVLQMPAPKYKELIRSAMPLAKSRGDKNSYSDVL